MSAARFSIGIDLGTTNSALAYAPLNGEAPPPGAERRKCQAVWWALPSPGCAIIRRTARRRSCPGLGRYRTGPEDLAGARLGFDPELSARGLEQPLRRLRFR